MKSLVDHLINPTGHNVLAFGPDQHPSECTPIELIAWHAADHETEDGVGPRDGHVHESDLIFDELFEEDAIEAEDTCTHADQHINDRSQFVCDDCGEELGR